MSEQNSERIESLVGISPRRLAILEEKARFFDMSEEARQVAGMLCLDIDLLAEVATDADLTLDDFRWYIEDLKSKKDQMLGDPKGRSERYSGFQGLIDCGALGADPRTVPQEPKS